MWKRISSLFASGPAPGRTGLIVDASVAKRSVEAVPPQIVSPQSEGLRKMKKNAARFLFFFQVEFFIPPIKGNKAKRGLNFPPQRVPFFQPQQRVSKFQ